MGIKNAVISPGSRNAALTVAFVRNPNINCISIPDERSAGFIALGMSLQTQRPTVLICTSGSAGLNYAPAVAEAYFNRVPLLILTADRPDDLINIRDGQTIFQKQLFGKHAKAYFDYPSFENENLEGQHKVVMEAISTSAASPFGPVQINIPFEEPFYPEEGKNYLPSPELALLKNPIQKLEFENLPEQIQNFETILIVAGQCEYSDELISAIQDLSFLQKIPIVGDVISNLHEGKMIIVHHDFFLGIDEDENLAPDLLLTFGLSNLSKKLKNLLRNCPKTQHWHVSKSKDSANTFGKLTRSIQSEPAAFFKAWNDNEYEVSNKQNSFYNMWHKREAKVQNQLDSLPALPFSDAGAYQEVLRALPENIDLHIANSMAVRYANLFGLKGKNGIQVFCNRGTSGIDGSSSTAVGSAIASGRETILLTGDLAFLYDRNAYWHNHLPDNISIIVFNNGGGGIFRLIKGPSDQPELEQYFETYQNSDASHLAKEFGFEYLTCRNDSELKEKIPNFFSTKKRKIMEIFTDKVENQKVYKHLFEIVN